MLASIIGFVVAFALIFFRMPIALALALVGVGGYAAMTGWNPAFVMLANSVRESSMTYGLSVIPLFILMGNVIAGSGVSADLFRAAQRMLGHRRGGLALAALFSSAGFAAVSGSSVATAVTMGKASLPSMRHYKYDPSFSAATLAAGATLGILIPPSIVMVVYGILTETHIGKLYAAGLLPGALAVLLYAVAIRWAVWRNDRLAPAAEVATWAQKLEALKGVWAVVVLFVFVLGGIYAGIFTAAEAAGAGAGGALLLSLLKRNMSAKVLLDILRDTAEMTAIIFAILLGAYAFTEFLNLTGVHTSLLALITAYRLPPLAVVFVIVLIYVVLGCIMESMSMVMITVPIFFPVIIGLGFDPVWFGILVVVVVELGLITPPLGVNLFAVRMIATDVPMGSLIRAVVPFIAVDMVRVTLLVLFPVITLYLPSLFFK